MRGLVDAIGAPRPARRAERTDEYGALVRSIVGQQLSTKAARSIYGRLTDRFGGRAPTPQEVLADDPEDLRVAVGLSRAKVKYLRSLAEHVEKGEVELGRLDGLSDEDVAAELLDVKGLGPWSVDMFLMFQLQRPDVLPVGDLGIRRAVEQAYGLDALPGPDELQTHRRAVAALPHAGVALPVGVAGQRAGLNEVAKRRCGGGQPLAGAPQQRDRLAHGA